jgi:hypothetical protein
VDSPTPRWSLLATTTNSHGVTHFTVTCWEATAGAEYEELLRVLKGRFGAVEDGELAGPYSIHQYMRLGGLRFGIVIEDPELLSLYAKEEPHKGALASLVPRLLDALNGPGAGQFG